MAKRRTVEPDELDVARAAWTEIETQHLALVDRITGLETAISLTAPGANDAHVSEHHRAKAEIFMRMAKRSRGREKTVVALADARDELIDRQPAYEDARMVWQSAQRGRTNQLAGNLQPRQQEAVKRIAGALEDLSLAIADEQRVRAELKSTAPLPESPKLPDLSSDLLDMAISTWNGTAWRWAQAVKKLGVL